MTPEKIKHIKKHGAVLAAGGLILVSWLSRAFGAPVMVVDGTMLAAAAVALPSVVKEAWDRLMMRQASIPLLVTIAAVGALFIGEIWEAAAVTFLFQLGGHLEAMTLARTRSALRSLIDLAPRTARVMQDSELVVIPVEDVSVGNVTVVLPGDRVPVDGKVLAGQAVLDTSPLTGEPMPVEAGPGTQVLGGSVSQSGYLEVLAERVGADTTFSRMLYLVAEAQEQKPKVQRFLDRFARWYTPLVILAALVIGIFWRDYHLALTFLVIACPGALVVAAPVAVVAGIGQAARQGVLIKGGERLERIARVNAVAFDKTGTLTLGKPAVRTVQTFGLDEAQVMALAAGAERRSEHHLGAAILQAANERGIEPTDMDEWELLAGRGVRARKGETEVLVGNRRLLQENGITLSAEQEAAAIASADRGETTAYVATSEVVGLLGISDTIRPDAASMVSSLKRAGMQVYMLTGDNVAAAQVVARQIGIDHVLAGLLPENKVETVRQLQRQGLVVAMVGDGVNDAPALAAADVSIAMGATGTQVAVETADLALISDALHRVPEAINLSRRILAVVRQNVVFAVAVVLFLLAGVLGKMVFLSGGMLVHELSVLAVIVNGMRLLQPQGGNSKTAKEDGRNSWSVAPN